MDSLIMFRTRLMSAVLASVISSISRTRAPSERDGGALG
jgi:hypothetical protein